MRARMVAMTFGSNIWECDLKKYRCQYRVTRKLCRKCSTFGSESPIRLVRTGTAKPATAEMARVGLGSDEVMFLPTHSRQSRA